MDKILYGSGDEYIDFHYMNDFGQKKKQRIQFEGVIHNINRRYHETTSDFTRETLSEVYGGKSLSNM